MTAISLMDMVAIAIYRFRKQTPQRGIATGSNLASTSKLVILLDAKDAIIRFEG